MTHLCRSIPKALTTCFLMGVFQLTGFCAELTVTGDKSIVLPDSKLETLWTDGGFTEGAAAGPDGCIYFSDFAQPFDSGPARVMKFDPRTKKVSVYCPDSGMGNGLMFTRDGRLIGCCASPLGGHRALVEFLPDGSVKPLVSKFHSKRFNSPNDLVIDAKGRVYFSDPKYVGPEKLELDEFNVYRFDPDGSLHVATREIEKPNGVMLSPDGKTLYVAETNNGSDTADLDKTPAPPGRMTLNAFDVAADGTLSHKRVLHDFGKETGIDGMTVDREGHIYAAVRSASRFGIVVFSSTGKELAYLETPVLPTNCVFGSGDQSRTLYITAGSGLYRIRLGIAGHHSALAE
ncbi:SMP-30/gluconolactonase/LRE family protein [bacterium]|nr:SMP-30/gluconolactonase/LRE family protein [bacterium]